MFFGTPLGIGEHNDAPASVPVPRTNVLDWLVLIRVPAARQLDVLVAGHNTTQVDAKDTSDVVPAADAQEKALQYLFRYDMFRDKCPNPSRRRVIWRAWVTFVRPESHLSD